MQDALTRNLARQYAPDSVRVIGVNPGWVNTEATAAAAAMLQVCRILLLAAVLPAPSDIITVNRVSFRGL